MLIWQTYWQKPMTALCNQVIGTAIKSGIYKITNIKTKECYIGQEVDIAARWKQHAKCGLGIDTPPANKLYKAIQEYGIWNFSWEVLEECSTKDLNEKEKYYIEAYKSKEYGYNSISGNKTKGGAS
jgi:group I intron endonuclease